jgi:hypothetical protein
MIKKLSAIGNSLGFIIERPILELLKIDQDTPLEVRTDGESLSQVRCVQGELVGLMLAPCVR